MISTPQVEGFDEVYKRNYTRLSQYAFHIIHDKGDAEDLANEAFLVYYQHMCLLYKGNYYVAWLCVRFATLTIPQYKYRKLLLIGQVYRMHSLSR